MDNSSQPDRSRTYHIMVYHVTDASGMHRFLTMNSISMEGLGGQDAFEEILAGQYKAFELLGSTPVFNSEVNQRVTFRDPKGSERLHIRVRQAMAAYPNSSGRLEPWLPAAEERVPQPPVDILGLPWRPPSELRKVKNLDFDKVGLLVTGAPLEDLVKPECLSAVRARGWTMLKELKEDVRQITEASLKSATDGPEPD